MKLANRASIIALTMLALIISMSAQTPRSQEDPRNTAPTVGTGGPPGGPTGLFTVYDGQTLRRGEFTFSAAYSNFDRDPGNVDLTEVPISFQVGLSDHLELFFTTDAYRAIKVNSPRNLSGFYLPNSQLVINGVRQSAPAIVLAPRGSGTSQFPGAVFRPTGNQGFTQFPFNGANAGTFGFSPPFNAGTVFGFTGGFATLGPARAGSGNGADLFPGIGSVYGSILPGIVLQTACLNGTTTCGNAARVPTVFSAAPSYLPDAPLLNRQYAESAFNTFNVGAKIRFTGPTNPVGVGIIPFYRFYADSADTFSGFNQLQRGASPGGGSLFSGGGNGRGDIGVIAFADARLRKYLNISGNIGYIYNSSIKGNDITYLDRPDEVLAGIALDFPVNKFFQPILEGRSTQYVGGRTPNAFENSPIEGLAGARVFPTRYFSLTGAFRYHFNQQDRGSFNDDTNFSGNVNVVGQTNTISTRFSGVPSGFATSSDPYGFIFGVAVGRRNSRGVPRPVNQFANVTNVTLSETRVTIPCEAGFQPREGTTCSTDMTTNVSTTAVDPENDVLTYNYTVSGGRIVGSGANVSWDLTGVNPGTYTITAGVDDGCGVCGETKTQTVTVERCDCVPVVVACTSCASLSVTGPSSVTRGGDTMTFTANVSGGSQTEVAYNWSVSQGEIISGQGTPVITVQTSPGMAGQNVTATVDISSSPGICDTCTNNTASEVAGIAPDTTLTPVDTFGALQRDDIKARIDNYYIQLGNDPSAQGYIINYGSARDIARREKEIRDAIRFLRRDPTRITFVRGGDRGNGIETQLYTVPSGAQPPTPDQ